MTAPFARRRVHELQIDTRANGHRAETLITIDGVDLLDLQRPSHRPDGSRYPYGRFSYLPTDPIYLLPPDSSVLLPTAEPVRAMVGICSCTCIGCGSLWAQVCRQGDRVIWEPTMTSGTRNTIDASYRFDVIAYLDAIDAGVRSVARWEQRPRRLARQLRTPDEDPEVRHKSAGHGAVLGMAHAGPNSDTAYVEILRVSGECQIALPVPDDLSDDQVMADLRRRVAAAEPPPAAQGNETPTA